MLYVVAKNSTTNSLLSKLNTYNTFLCNQINNALNNCNTTTFLHEINFSTLLFPTPRNPPNNEWLVLGDTKVYFIFVYICQGISATVFKSLAIDKFMLVWRKTSSFLVNSVDMTTTSYNKLEI